LGFVDAQEQCRSGTFDLCLIGHSVVPADKQALMAAFRETHTAPIIVMLRVDEEAPRNVVIHSAADGPRVLLERIRQALDSVKA
jgi:hypothetical protein